LADFPINSIGNFFLLSFGVYKILLWKFVTYYCLYHIFYQEYSISYTEVLIFYADKLTVMGNSKNLHVFNCMILFKLRKSQKFDDHKIYTEKNKMTFFGTQCTCFTVNALQHCRWQFSHKETL